MQKYVFIVLFIILAYFPGLWTDSWLIEILFLWLMAIPLIYPVMAHLYPWNMRFFKRLSFHSVFMLLLIGGISWLNQDIMSKQGITNFSYRLANGAGPLRFIYQNYLLQHWIGKSLGLLPVEAQYSLYNLEDLRRIKDVSEAFKLGMRQELCPDIKEFECFKKIMQQLNQNPPMVTGISSLMLAGSTLLKEDRLRDTDERADFELFMNIFYLMESTEELLKAKATQARTVLKVAKSSQVAVIDQDLRRRALKSLEEKKKAIKLKGSDRLSQYRKGTLITIQEMTAFQKKIDAIDRGKFH